MECNLCRRPAVTKAEIDGVVLDVCRECIKYGKEMRQIAIIQKKKDIRMPEEESVIRSDFSKIVREERQKQNLTQEQLAKQLKEKSSVVKRIEEGWEPSMTVVSKLERFFKISLTETASRIETKKADKKELTIGDIAEMK